MLMQELNMGYSDVMDMPVSRRLRLVDSTIDWMKKKYGV